MKTITTTEAVKKLGLNCNSTLYYLCEKGKIKGFDKQPAKDKYSVGKYTFYSNLHWVVIHSKEEILKACSKRNISRREIKEIIGDDRFNKLLRSRNHQYFENDEYYSKLFNIVGINCRAH